MVKISTKPATVEVPATVHDPAVPKVKVSKAAKPGAVEVTSAILLAQQAIALASYNDALHAAKVCVCVCCESLSVCIILDSSFAHQIRNHRQDYRRLIEELFTIQHTANTDNCLFSCIAAALTFDGVSLTGSKPFRSQDVRAIVADYIVEMKGEIYNHRTSQYDGPVSSKKFEKHVRKPHKRTVFSCVMHLQAHGIRDGRFIGTDKELDLLVEIFMLRVQIYDSSDALPVDDAEYGDLSYSEYKSVTLPASGDPNDRLDVILFRENIFEYSLLYRHPQKEESPDAVSDYSMIKTPKFTTSHYGEFSGVNRPRVLLLPSPPSSISLFSLIYSHRRSLC